jgi:hypothetical protein
MQILEAVVMGALLEAVFFCSFVPNPAISPEWGDLIEPPS